MGDRKWDWENDLPDVLWAYQTTRRTPTEETPYALAFGTKVIILVELGWGSLKVETFKVEANDKGLKLHLNLL